MMLINQKGEKFKMYNHIEYTDEFITLHDCEAERIIFDNNVLSFVFSDGFWITDKNPFNESDNIVRTDCSQVDFEIIDDEIEIYVFEKENGRVLREQWEIQSFGKAVNDKDFKVEFIDRYNGTETVLFKGFIHFDRVPFRKECEIILHIVNEKYMWNVPRYDRIW